ncbi:MAG: HNH endonuclease [Candidatus Nanohaloarchaea archaeon]
MAQNRRNRHEPQADIEDINIDEIPRIGIPVIGAFLVYAAVSVGLNDMMLNLIIGGAGVVLIAIFGIMVGRKYQNKGVQEAIDYALTAPIEEKENTKSRSSDDEVEKTPPASDKLKNKLIFERADHKCEYCGDEADHPEVHHIKPRSEGGENKPSNLIVLCPNCHRKADSGTYSRSKLKYRVRKSKED